MANRPKPVPQMTDGPIRCPLPGEATTKPAFATWLRAAGRKAFIARAAVTLTCTTLRATSRFTGNALNARRRAYRFSALAGTIFENTKKPLRVWYRVAYLMLSSKKGMSAHQIYRMMGFGNYDTAHGMCHKIRAALIAAGNHAWRHCRG